MNSESIILAVVEALESLGIPYMLVGSLSSSYYGIPRLTQGVDIVVELGGRSVSEVARRLGPGFRLDPQMRFETNTTTYRHIIEVIGSPFKVELFQLSRDPHDQERFRRRVRASIGAREVILPTAEDVIVMKLRWAAQGGRSKDRDDIRGVVAVQGAGLDWGYIHSWCEPHGTRELLDEIRRSLPTA